MEVKLKVIGKRKVVKGKVCHYPPRNKGTFYNPNLVYGYNEHDWWNDDEPVQERSFNFHEDANKPATRRGVFCIREYVNSLKLWDTVLVDFAEYPVPSACTVMKENKRSRTRVAKIQVRTPDYKYVWVREGQIKRKDW